MTQLICSVRFVARFLRGAECLCVWGGGPQVFLCVGQRAASVCVRGAEGPSVCVHEAEGRRCLCARGRGQ